MGKQLIATGQATVIAQKDSYTINQSVSEYIFTAQSNGIISAAVSFSSILKVTLGDLNITDFTIGTITKPSGFSTITVNNTNKSVTYSIAAGTITLADSGLIAIPVIIGGVTYQVSFSWSKAKAGATGPAGSPGTDANMLDWVQDWNSNKTIIGSNSVITPKVFAGTKNANGTITGTAIGRFSLSTLNASGSVTTETIDGVYGFKDGNKTFALDNTGNVQLGRGNQYIKYNAATGRVEFGSDVSLAWIGATFIDRNGIFTGTLSAGTVNALQLNASQIVAGTINAARIDVASLKASLITAGNIEALTLNVVRGKIGGWSIDSDSIYRGAKHNTTGAYTSGSGSITIGSNGIRGFKWRLDSTGAGALAGGNISWDANGNVTFGSNVTLNWTNAANSAATNALNSAKSYADTKKTEAINAAATDATNKVNNLNIGGRNFARNTANLKTYTLSTGAGSLGYPTTGLKKGDVITVSFEIDINIPSWTSGIKMLQFDQNYNYVCFYSFSSGDNKKGWLKRTAQLTINNVWNTTNPATEVMTSNPYMRMDNISTELANGGYVKVRNFKVEKGNKATDWTPSPEDVESRLTKIDANGIYTGTLTAAQVNAVAINASSITTGTLSADRIAANSLNGNKITARTISADRIIAGAVTANEIAANTITAAKIASRTITADRIAAGVITASEINVGSVRASVLTADAVNALTCNFVRGKIGGFSIGSDTMTIGSIGADGATPIQIRSTSTGSGYWYTGSYKPLGITLTWHKNANAGHIVFGQIAATGSTIRSGFIGLQMMAWDNTEYFCLSANYTRSGGKEVYNRIAGWAFDNTRIWKNNVSLGSDGAIYNGEKWRLNNDGSGKIANGNISWNAAGTVTFSASVTLNWTNAATNALNSAKAYADTKKNEAISSASTDATNKANAAKELASAMAFGRMLNRDPTFWNGNNGINIYNNSGNGTVTISRTTNSNAPNDSKYVLLIKNTGAASPFCGGFYFGTNTSYRKIFITRIIAKIPSGRNISYHSNAIGTGGTQKWLTPVAGTGDWCEYICKVICGTATFSSTHFFAIDGSAGTASNPVQWWLAYATVFDVTSTEKYTTTIDANGIYTSTLNANQITAGTISADRIATGSLHGNKITARTITASQIATGTITANEINVGSIQASVVTAGAVNGLTCTFNKGKIGGFTISGTAIYSINVTPGHNVGIQSNGYIYNCNSSNTAIDYWALNTDGSATFGTGKIKFGASGDGWLANKNISWDASGNVTMTGTITATAGKIGNFNITGGKLVNSTTTASIEFSGLSGSSLYLNTTSSLISIRSDVNKTGISIQTYSSGARGIYIVANAGSTYSIEAYGPMQLGQRTGERWCVPGVLYVGCKYSAGYNNYYRKVWGDGMTVSSFSHIGDGKYRVYHNLAHTDYTVMAILWSSTGYYGYFRLLERTSSYFVIQNIGSSGKPDQAPFDFVVMGRNRW